MSQFHFNLGGTTRKKNRKIYEQATKLSLALRGRNSRPILLIAEWQRKMADDRLRINSKIRSNDDSENEIRMQNRNWKIPHSDLLR
ncbi:hypothetical protein JTE90_023156 [Oedothorax gibbosus]|uniref:Uncharacterized protein n=1 Tax=Oedothorax gibbosus TaxID=931172 RepID=A0AAV6US37_9ARAC|nr:hypothetical protein JTE90_023156 [Oedothorax gibbosus]